MQIKEYLVETCVDNWTEVRVESAEITVDFLLSLRPGLSRLQPVQRCYVAANGLIRIDVKGLTPEIKTIERYFNDIAIHPYDGYFIIMRNDNQEFRPIEDKIINYIIKKIKEKNERH